jgi:hypothetical protein
MAIEIYGVKVKPDDVISFSLDARSATEIGLKVAFETLVTGELDLLCEQFGVAQSYSLTFMMPGPSFRTDSYRPPLVLSRSQAPVWRYESMTPRDPSSQHLDLEIPTRLKFYWFMHGAFQLRDTPFPELVYGDVGCTAMAMMATVLLTRHDSDSPPLPVPHIGILNVVAPTAPEYEFVADDDILGMWRNFSYIASVPGLATLARGDCDRYDECAGQQGARCTPDRAKCKPVRSW